ncbi:MAG: hemolysin family protein [Desulfobacterales bacterium]|nr:hemolysin family protein [Desulfobacterales bacterium]
MDYLFETDFIFKMGSIFLLLLVSGFFSGTEASLFSLTLIQKEKLKEQHPRAGKTVEALLNNPRRLIITILTGNDMINIAASVIATDIFIGLFPQYGHFAAVACMTTLTLVFAEIIPKTFAVIHNEKVASLAARPLAIFSRIILPLRFVFDATAGAIVKALGFRINDAAAVLMEEEFREMVDQSHRGGKLKERERDFIHNVFEFSDTRVHRVMTPKDQIFSLKSATSLEEARNQVTQAYFSRIPVYDTHPDEVKGILYVKDLIAAFSDADPDSKTVGEIMRAAPTVSQNTLVDKLFYTLKKHRNHMVLCVDDQNVLTGLVTLEDLLEELFGEIYDEYDREDTR